jgi:hypothetical protein
VKKDGEDLFKIFNECSDPSVVACILEEQPHIHDMCNRLLGCKPEAATTPALGTSDSPQRRPGNEEHTSLRTPPPSIAMIDSPPPHDQPLPPLDPPQSYSCNLSLDVITSLRAAISATFRAISTANAYSPIPYTMSPKGPSTHPDVLEIMSKYRSRIDNCSHRILSID